MDLENIENKKLVNVYYFNKLKKLKFEKFEIYLGFDKHTQYFVNDYYKEIYKKSVKIKDYEKLGLIDSKIIDIKELLVDSKWDSLEELIEKKSNSKELFKEIEELMRYYIEDTLYSNEKGSFELVDFSFIYLIDGEKKELIDFNEKRRKILINILVYSSVFFVISGFILFFVDIIIGTMVMMIPLMYYLIYVFYNLMVDLRNELKYDREGKNILLYYLIKLPFKIVYYSFYLILILGWFLIPGYFIFESSFYQSLLDILGGVIGQSVWGLLYFLILIYLGEKLLDYITKIENKIKSYF